MSRRLRVVIHGGMHKTGTTSLQQLLALRRRELAEAGIYYPETPAGHHADLLNVKRSNWKPDAVLAELEKAEQALADVIFFSAEIVSTLSADQFRKLTDCFLAHDLTYIFCFRHWSEYLPSRWVQYSKRRDSQTFSEYCRVVTRPDSEHVDYRFDLVLTRAASSGHCRVVAQSYDNAMQTEGSVIPAILRAAEFGKGLAAFLVRHSMQLNARTDWKLSELFRLCNGIAADQRNLPQDDLCRSVSEYRICNVHFDLGAKLNSLDAAIADELLELVESRKTKATIPTESSAMRMLSDEHGHRFVNRGAIFPEKRTSEIVCTDWIWQDFRDSISKPTQKIVTDWCMS